MAPSFTGWRRTLSDAEIVRLYVEEGLDSDTIGARAACSGTTVLDKVRNAGHPVRKPGGRRKTAILKLSEEQICALYRAGESAPAIADRAACATSTIYLILRRHQIPRRPDAARMASRKARARRGGGDP
jgi:DNA-binding CsgD family transcriptional regulator